MLLDHGLLGQGQAVILQPRRIAARLLAARVAHERGVQLGVEVGYQVRFENRASARTRIKYVTEGILLRQMVRDPGLDGVSALVFDEFHERHLDGDICLARALDLQATTRPGLLILVMSATLPTRVLESYLTPCATVTSAGRQFEVNLEYAPHRGRSDTWPVWERAAEAFAEHVRAGGSGDALIFMPGVYEIQQTLAALGDRPEARGYLRLPLHGELAARDQDAAVANYRQPKVVVATNVAETSLTIEGIRLVIDSGLARVPRYDPHRGINTLLVEKISQAAADQRAGRAGRTAPGRCLRLWAAAEHGERPRHELPEVQRLDLAEVVLALKAGGITDLQRFRWLEPPAAPRLQDAETLLTDLGALDPAGHITPLGRRMLAFPLHPRYARMLLAAEDYDCVHPAALVAALTQGRDLLVRNPGREVEGVRQDLAGDQAPSDFWMLMAAYDYARRNNFDPAACRQAGIHAPAARQVGPVLEHFLRIAQAEGLKVNRAASPGPGLLKCVLIGFSDRVARRPDETSLRCELVHGRGGQLARESVVRAPLLVAAEVREVEASAGTLNTILSLATALDPEWLLELFPSDIQRTPRASFDPVAKRVQAVETVTFRDLAIGERHLQTPPAAVAAGILAEEVLQGRLALKHWDEGVEQWILRLNRLQQWCPELGLPPIGPEERRNLVEQVCLGSYSQRDLKEREVLPTVKAWLSPPQQALLEQHAPERVTLANGRSARVIYPPEGAPYLALRIQELYGVTATPRIARNRVPLVLHILAPSMRPVQITQDLPGFWREHYPRIKQELQRRYPKHLWR